MTWIQIVEAAEAFPDAARNRGLGCSFAWSQWAGANRVVDLA